MMPLLPEMEAVVLGPGVAGGWDGELPRGSSVLDLAGEAMPPVVVMVAGPDFGVGFIGEGGRGGSPTMAPAVLQ